jgi:hypothetical protein
VTTSFLPHFLDDLPVKALSMMQPYAWLFANGILTIDDRSWSTSYRGQLAIHASKRFHLPYYVWLEKHTNLVLPLPNAMDSGGVVGVAHLSKCLKSALADKAPPLDMRRSHFGQAGFYGFELERAKPVAFVPCKGNVGLFDLPDGLIRA